MKIERYITAAQKCLEDLNQHSQAGSVKQLRHSRRGNNLAAEVFLDDYAFVLQALLDLYEATFDIDFLHQAHILANVMLDRFQPASGQPLQLTPLEQASAIPVRTVLDDGVTPAGNSVALVSLRRLAYFSEDRRFEKESKAIMKSLAGYLQEQAATAPELLHAWDYQPISALKIIIVGRRDHPETQNFLQEARRRFIPGLVLAMIEPEQKVDLQAWPIFSGRYQINEKPTAYVCGISLCRLPVNHAEDLAQQLDF